MMGIAGKSVRVRRMPVFAHRVLGICRRGGMLFAFMSSFSVVFGGWFLTAGLLERREEKFLAREGSVTVQSAESALLSQEKTKEFDTGVSVEREGAQAESQSGEVAVSREENQYVVLVKGQWDSQETQISSDEKAYQQGDMVAEQRGSREVQVTAEQEEYREESAAMSDSVRYMVLSFWEKGGSELLHEPKPGQINMEQAIQAGRDWMSSMAGYGNIPKELEECNFDKTSAVLCTLDGQVLDNELALDESLSSYWTVRFEKSDVTVKLKIHAASGEVWEADLSVENKSGLVESFDEGRLLDRAFPFLKENNKPTKQMKLVTDLYTSTTYQSFAQGLMYAAVKQYEVNVSDASPVTRIAFWLHTCENVYESGYYH